MKALVSKFLMVGVLVFLSTILMNPACYVPSDEDKTGDLSISVSLANAKISGADIVESNFTFKIDGSGPSGNTFSVTTAAGALTANVTDLAIGAWTISVEAFYNGVSFGDGSGSVYVNANSTSACAISITPFTGTGTLQITVNWDSSMAVSPVLEGTLSRTGYETVSVAFTMGTGTASATLSLASGLYDLAIVLKDGSTYEIGGVANKVRITNLLTTNAVCNIVGTEGTGSISISITINIPASIDAVISGGASSIAQGNSMTLTASATGETDTISYSWYLNGRLMGTGASYVVPATLLPGVYRVDLIADSSDYTRAGSASLIFTVTE